LVKGIGLSSPTETNDERQKAPLLVSGERTGTKGFSRKTKKSTMASACTGIHTCTQLAPPPPLLIMIAKNTNIGRTQTRSSIPYQYHLTVHHTITITTISHSTSPLA
jgi:hypothetical protein